MNQSILLIRNVHVALFIFSNDPLSEEAMSSNNWRYKSLITVSTSHPEPVLEMPTHECHHISLSYRKCVSSLAVVIRPYHKKRVSCSAFALSTCCSSKVKTVDTSLATRGHSVSFSANASTSTQLTIAAPTASTLRSRAVADFLAVCAVPKWLREDICVRFPARRWFRCSLRWR